jgi:hypothetical protein
VTTTTRRAAAGLPTPRNASFFLSGGTPGSTTPTPPPRSRPAPSRRDRDRPVGADRGSAACPAAVATLINWHAEGADVQARLPVLSTWMGHVKPSSTYWYLQAAPELLAVTAVRLERYLGLEHDREGRP